MSEKKESKIIEEVEEKVQAKIEETNMESNLLNTGNIEDTLIDKEDCNLLANFKKSIKSTQSKDLEENLKISDVLDQNEKSINELANSNTQVMNEQKINSLSNDNIYECQQDNTKKMLDVKEEKNTSNNDTTEILLPSADSTLDLKSAMLFGNEESGKILKSILNILLDFTGNNLIKKIKVNPNELVDSYVSHQNSDTGIPSTVDILCTTYQNRKIVVKIMGQELNFLLNSEQEDKAKLYDQAKEAQKNKYNLEEFDTYTLVISNENLFVGNKVLKGNVIGNPNLKAENLYEFGFDLVVKQTGEVIPGNKRHWKIIELPKFKDKANYKSIKENSLQKEKCLEFLIECNEAKISDRKELIQKGYDIMNSVTWVDPLISVLLWKQRVNEIDAQQQRIIDKEEAFKAGFLRGKLKVKLARDIEKIMMGIEFEIEPKRLLTNFKYLSKKRFLEKDWSKQQLEKISKKTKHVSQETNKSVFEEVSNMFSKFIDIFNYVKDHKSEPAYDICENLKLADDMEEIGYKSDFSEINIY